MIWLLAYIATIVGANLALKTFGILEVPYWGLMIPAGTLFAGLALTFRDMTHESLGRGACVLAIAVGACISYAVEDVQKIALASFIAFGCSELLDMAIYEPLRGRWLVAVIISNAFGLILDSILFLWLAFGSLDFLEGQIAGKAFMTAVAVVLLWLVRNLEILPWNTPATLASQRRLATVHQPPSTEI